MKLRFWKKSDKDKEIKKLNNILQQRDSEIAHLSILVSLKAEVVSTLKYQNEQLRDMILDERGDTQNG